jgi:hypothetical protein
MNRNIIHFNVGNGNCSIIQTEDCLIIIDLNKSEEYETSYDMLKPFFRKKNDILYIDILCITHGDEDHCLGFREFKEEIDNGELIIGSIWHQDYDRTKNHNKKTDPVLPTDYLELQNEIDRRKNVSNPEDGDLQIPLKAKNDEIIAFKGLEVPSNLFMKVLSPFDGDKEDGNYNHNDLSLIINFEINGKTILYTGDVSSKYWQERIFPDLLEKEVYNDWANSDILEVGHHGSYDFFGQDREGVRDSDTEPDNYQALDKIEPADLIISAKSKFPLSGDKSGDLPPHYAAWKWYHKWFKDNHNVDKDDKHPDQFKYTSTGNVRLEYDGSTWSWKLNWNIDDEKKNQAKRFTEKMRIGELFIGNLNAKPTNYYGEDCI